MVPQVDLSYFCSGNGVLRYFRTRTIFFAILLVLSRSFTHPQLPQNVTLPTESKNVTEFCHDKCQETCQGSCLPDNTCICNRDQLYLEHAFVLDQKIMLDYKCMLFLAGQYDNFCSHYCQRNCRSRFLQANIKGICTENVCKCNDILTPPGSCDTDCHKQCLHTFNIGGVCCSDSFCVCNWKDKYNFALEWSCDSICKRRCKFETGVSKGKCSAVGSCTCNAKYERSNCTPKGMSCNKVCFKECWSKMRIPGRCNDNSVCECGWFLIDEIGQVPRRIYEFADQSDDVSYRKCPLICEDICRRKKKNSWCADDVCYCFKDQQTLHKY